jgi:hypothetical protein
MTRFERTCSYCNQPFDVYLPEETVKVSYNKCEDQDATCHNLKHMLRCLNCDEGLTLYYCSNDHPLTATEN